MNEQDALKELKRQVLCWESGKEFAYSLEPLKIAKKALEKQIPKKPVMEGDGYADGYPVYDTWICPNCETHYEVDFDRYDYCPKCGQKLDLSEVN